MLILRCLCKRFTIRSVISQIIYICIEVWFFIFSLYIYSNNKKRKCALQQKWVRVIILESYWLFTLSSPCKYFSLTNLLLFLVCCVLSWQECIPSSPWKEFVSYSYYQSLLFCFMHVILVVYFSLGEIQVVIQRKLCTLHNVLFLLLVRDFCLRLFFLCCSIISKNVLFLIIGSNLYLTKIKIVLYYSHVPVASVYCFFN